MTDDLMTDAEVKAAVKALVETLMARGAAHDLRVVAFSALVAIETPDDRMLVDAALGIFADDAGSDCLAQMIAALAEQAMMRVADAQAGPERVLN